MRWDLVLFWAKDIKVIKRQGRGHRYPDGAPRGVPAAVLPGAGLQYSIPRAAPFAVGRSLPCKIDDQSSRGCSNSGHTVGVNCVRPESCGRWNSGLQVT